MIKIVVFTTLLAFSAGSASAAAVSWFGPKSWPVKVQHKIEKERDLSPVAFKIFGLLKKYQQKVQCERDCQYQTPSEVPVPAAGLLLLGGLGGLAMVRRRKKA